jgi:O-antigen ligase
MEKNFILYPSSAGEFAERFEEGASQTRRAIADHTRDLWFEKSACVLIMAFYGMSGFIPLVGSNQAVDPAIATNPGGAAAVVGIGSQLVIAVLIFLLLLRRFHHVMKSVLTLHWGGIFAILAVVSVIWSQDPMVTARRAIPFLLSTLFALYFASRFDLDEQLSILWITMIALSVATVLISVAVPSYGLDVSPGHTHDWRGVFTQKNACGRAMAFAIAITLAKGRMNLPRILSLLLFLVVLAMSGSRSFWLVGLSAFAVAALFAFLKRYDLNSRSIIVSMTVLLSIVTLALGVIFASDILALLGRDATLTGRSDIWREVWRAILKRPLLGYGFSAFWIGLKGEAFNVITMLGFVILHAHNGLLEIMLELGSTGLAIFALSYLRACRRALRLIRSKYIEQALWPILILFLTVLSNMDENSLLIYNGIFWVLYVTALVNLELLQQQLPGSVEAHELAGSLVRL